MKRNAILPYILIMVMGILLVAGVSTISIFYSKEASGDGTQEEGEEVALTPEEIYAQSCLGCHGENYEGAMGPALTNLGERLSDEEIREVLVNGRGPMPGNLVPGEALDDMIEWLLSLQ